MDRIENVNNRITEDFWIVETVCKPPVDKLEAVKEALLEYEEWLREHRRDLSSEDVRSRIIDFIDIIEREV